VKLITPVEYAEPLVQANEPRPLTLRPGVDIHHQIMLGNNQEAAPVDQSRSCLIAGDDQGSLLTHAQELGATAVEEDSFILTVEDFWVDYSFTKPISGFALWYFTLTPVDTLYWFVPFGDVIRHYEWFDWWYWETARSGSYIFTGGDAMNGPMDVKICGLTI